MLHLGNGGAGPSGMEHLASANGHVSHRNGTIDGDRAVKLKQYVRSLNEQFARWVAQQWEQKPEKFWSHGMLDYLRHSVIIRRDCLEGGGKKEGQDRPSTSRAKENLRDRGVSHEAQLTIVPMQHTKVIHFVRHGEGFHNVGIVNEDAHLTETGWRQAEALHKHTGSLRPPLDVQLVVTSPMVRALETAVGAFGGGVWQGRGRVLMLDQKAEPGVRASHAAVASVDGLPFIAFEGCRERLGPSACDRRRDIRHAKKHFPGIDFSHIECNKDEVYEKHHIESEHAVQERGGRFLQWLMARQETRIAVVSHCGFLFMMLSTFGHECAANVQDDLHRGFDNCEMRTLVICDAAGSRSNPNTTWFSGGRRCLS